MIDFLPFASLILAAYALMRSAMNAKKQDDCGCSELPNSWLGKGLEITGFPYFVYPPFSASEIQNISIHQKDANGNCVVQLDYQHSLISIKYSPETVDWIEQNKIEGTGHPLIKYLKLHGIIE